MRNLIPLAFEEHLVRVVSHDDQPWFVGKDVCDSIGLKNSRSSLDLLDDDEKAVHTMGVTSDNKRARHSQEMTIISEPGVYRLVFRSRKPQAERFKRWLAHEVLPSLRKTGEYSQNKTLEQDKFGAGTDSDPAGEAMMHRIQVVKEARLLFGRERAQAMWRAVGLPEVPPPPMTSIDEARGCLRHLLDSWIHEEGPTVRIAIEEALDGSENDRAKLMACGIRVFDEREAFVVANRHDWLREVYQDTCWSGSLTFMRVLRRLPQAQACGPFRYNGLNLRGTLLPGELLDDQG